MANKIVPITVMALAPYGGLDGPNADNYYRADQRKSFLGSEVINPFSVAIKESTGYDDENIPDGVVETAKDIGSLRFGIKVKPTEKRPELKQVFDDVRAYVGTRLAQYKAGERPVGVLTLDGEPYISAHEILGLISKSRKKVTSKGVSIELSDQPAPIETGSVVVPLGMDMAELTEGNAQRYLQACYLAGRFGEFVSAFEGDLLGLTGFDDEHLPGQTEHMYQQIGGHIFHVRSIPYESTSYGKVIDGLDHEPGKKKVENGGDLKLVTLGIEVPRLKVYDPRSRDGDRVVRLKGLAKRMDELVKDNTETKLRQKPIGHYPLV